MRGPKRTTPTSASANASSTAAASEFHESAHTRSTITSQLQPRDWWDKADIIGKLLGSILIPIGLAAAGFLVNSALQDRSAKLKTEEIAITVLQSNNSTPELKLWAVQVFKQMLVEASLPLSPGASDELQNSPLPSAGNHAGTGLVSEFEGFHSTPYQDVAGVWTIGFGHTQGVGPDTPPITIERARVLLGEDLKDVNAEIDRLVKVPLSADQREALVDFAWNVGIRAFAGSSALHVLNAGEYEKLPERLRVWTLRSTNGKLSTDPGLVHRRERDIEVWNRPKTQSSH
jgi:GH24 family phage-related lysozyme (muramidase)